MTVKKTSPEGVARSGEHVPAVQTRDAPEQHPQGAGGVQHQLTAHDPCRPAGASQRHRHLVQRDEVAPESGHHEQGVRRQQGEDDGPVQLGLLDVAAQVDQVGQQVRRVGEEQEEGPDPRPPADGSRPLVTEEHDGEDRWDEREEQVPGHPPDVVREDEGGITAQPPHEQAHRGSLLGPRPAAASGSDVAQVRGERERLSRRPRTAGCGGARRGPGDRRRPAPPPAGGWSAFRSPVARRPGTRRSGSATWVRPPAGRA